MAIDDPAKHHLKIRRGRDYSKIFNFTGDYSAYTGEAEVRKNADVASTLLLTFSVSVGAYAAGVTPITISTDKATTLALKDGTGKWDLALSSGGSGETYVYGNATILDAPTDLS